MKAIYEPKGKAREYCDLAVNLFKGCSHGCSYCFAPDIWRKQGMTKEDFYNQPQARIGILEAIKREAPRYNGREIQLCFTCDPYQPINNDLQITRKAIEILKANNLTVRILTKGGFRSIADFDLLEAGRDWYGATLSFDNFKKSMAWEPDAATPRERYICLEVAKKAGLNTWASIEPVIDPEESYQAIKACLNFVDVFKIGKWNHDSRANNIDWGTFINKVVALLKEHHIGYYVKQDLRKYLR